MRVAYFADRPWPCDHSFVQDLMAGELPLRGVGVEIVFGGPGAVAIRRYGYKNAMATVASGPAWLRAVLRAGLLLRRACQGSGPLVIRNDLPLCVLALLCGAGPRLVCHLSHLMEESVLARVSDGSGGACSSLRAMAARTSRWLRGVVVRRARQTWAVSRGMLELLRDTGQVPRRAVVIPLGAQPQTADELPTRTVEAACCFVYIGTLNRMRRFDVLIAGFERLDVDLGGCAQLVIAGSGPDRNDERLLEELITASPAGGRIKYCGRLPRAAIGDLLRQADVGISIFPDIPLFRQNSPIKVMEYLAHGLPVVCSRQPEQAQLVTACRGGVVLPQFDAEHVARGMKAAMRRDWDRPEMIRRFAALRGYPRIAEFAHRALRRIERPGWRTLTTSASNGCTH